MASVRTKIQTETQRKGPPKNLGKGELAYNEVDGLLYIGAGSENRGQARNKLAIGGEEFSDPAGQLRGQLTEDELKGILKVEGDTVGTLNTQDISNKGIDSGTFI
jgi:hypothetical protein